MVKREFVAVLLTVIQGVFEVADQVHVDPVVTGTSTVVAVEPTVAVEVPRTKEQANEAATLNGAFTVTAAGFPTKSPLQPANVYPVEGVAVSCACAPAASQVNAGVTLPPVDAVACTRYSIR
jgi:hypothetical protein